MATNTKMAKVAAKLASMAKTSNSSTKTSNSNSSTKTSNSNSNTKTSNTKTSSTSGAGSVASLSSSPSTSLVKTGGSSGGSTSIGGTSFGTSFGGTSGSSSSGSSSKSSGSSGSTSKSSGRSTSGTIPSGVASTVGGGTLLKNGTIVGGVGGTSFGTSFGGTSGSSSSGSSSKSSGSSGSSSKSSGSSGNSLASGYIGAGAINTLSNFRNAVSQTNSTGGGTTGSTSSGSQYLGANAFNTLKNSTQKNNTQNTVSRSGLLGADAFGAVKNAVKSSGSNFDYTKENANGSLAISQGADGTIKYADGTVYDPKTGVTINPKTGEVVDALGANGKFTEQEIIQNANNRQNNVSLGNSSTRNNIGGSGGGTKSTQNTKNDQSAMSMILKSLNEDQGGASLVSKSLDTGGNRTIESQERGLVDNGDGTQTYIAPNGKQYLIGTDDNGNLAFISQGQDTKGEIHNFTMNGEISNDVDALVDYIRSQNNADGINRSNVDNKDAYKGAGAQIEGTYIAPSGKEYDILTGTGENAGKTGFININGEAQWFDSQDAALNYIDQRNPVGNKDLAKNTALPTLADRGSYDGEIPETGLDAIDEQNEWNQDERDERDEQIAQLLAENEKLLERLNESTDSYDRELGSIIQQSLGDFNDFSDRVNDAIADLQEKTELLQDNERMRWARQRAAELAAKGYLTSEQVAQVANYSLSDYNKELEASALEAAKAIAELKVNIEQKKQDYLAAIRSQQYTNAANKLAQENYVNDWASKMLDAIDTKAVQADQFYHGIISSNLQMNAQQELGYDSIIRQNDAQNIVNDRNQKKAFTDTEYRRQYILDNITDTNLHAYANQAINYLINQNEFVFPGKTDTDNKRILAEQISKVTDVARQLQLANQKDLAKVS